MMTVKLVGSLLLVIASGATGWLVADGYARRPRELRGLQTALQMLETEITYGASPLPEALLRAGQRSEGPARPIFLAARERLLSGLGCTAAEAWCEAVDAEFAETALTAADRAILQSFGASLGASDREDQLKHLGLAREQLKQEEVKAAAEGDKNTRLWRYLGVLTGLAVCLAII